MAEFIEADVTKLADFERDSAEVIKEFDAIKKEFDNINSTLLSKWDGKGAAAYKKETDHILEKVGGVESVLKEINEGVVKCIKDNYDALDEELAEFNRNPPVVE